MTATLRLDAAQLSALRTFLSMAEQQMHQLAGECDGMSQMAQNAESRARYADLAVEYRRQMIEARDLIKLAYAAACEAAA